MTECSAKPKSTVHSLFPSRFELNEVVQKVIVALLTSVDK